MNKLSVKSGLIIINNIIDNLSYEDSKQLREIIIKEQFNYLFCIRHKQVCEKNYFFISNSKEDAIDKFIRNNKIDDYQKGDYSKEESNIKWFYFMNPVHYIVNYFIRCHLCNMNIFPYNKDTYNIICDEHIKYHSIEEIIEYRKRNFKIYYFCEKIELN
jgi:hypothetical protein